MKIKIAAVDFDGTLSRDDYLWRGDMTDMGEPIEGARNFLLEVRAKGYEIIIYTCRMGCELCNTVSKLDQSRELLEAWLQKHNIPYDSIWGKIGKPIANVYIDDRSVRCTPMTDTDAFSKALELL